MDKRYLLIGLIIFVCIINLYIITDFSEVVGSASVNIDDYTFSIPRDFNLMNTYDDYVTISNDKIGLNLAVYKINNNFDMNDILSNFKNSSDYIVLSNGTIKTKDINIDSIYYKSVDDSKNRSVFYFTKNNVSFKVEMSNFNYDDKNITIETIVYIADSMRVNYKK